MPVRQCARCAARARVGVAVRGNGTGARRATAGASAGVYVFTRMCVKRLCVEGAEEECRVLCSHACADPVGVFSKQAGHEKQCEAAEASCLSARQAS